MKHAGPAPRPVARAATRASAAVGSMRLDRMRRLCLCGETPGDGCTGQMDDRVDTVQQVEVGGFRAPLTFTGVAGRVAHQGDDVVAARGQKGAQGRPDQARRARHSHPQGPGAVGASPFVGSQIAGELALPVGEDAPQPSLRNVGVDRVSHFRSRLSDGAELVDVPPTGWPVGTAARPARPRIGAGGRSCPAGGSATHFTPAGRPSTARPSRSEWASWTTETGCQGGRSRVRAPGRVCQANTSSSGASTTALCWKVMVRPYSACPGAVQRLPPGRAGEWLGAAQ